MQQLEVERADLGLYGHTQHLPASPSPLIMALQQLQHHNQHHHPYHSQLQLHQPPPAQSSSLAHHHHRPSSPGRQHLQLLAPSRNSATLHTSLPPPPLIEDKETSMEDDCYGGGGCCRRWPSEETECLVRIGCGMDAILHDSGVKLLPLRGEAITRRSPQLGYHTPGRTSKEKFETVHNYYNKAKGGKSYGVFSEVEAFRSSANNNTDITYNSNGHGGLGRACATQGYGRAGDEERASAKTVFAAATSGGLNRSSDASSQNDDEENGNGDANAEEEDEDDNGDEVYADGHGRANNCRKRKRKSSPWSGMKLFLEKLVWKVMEQQEAFHNKLLETIGRVDEERLMREEACRKQEAARLRREYELRARQQAMAAARDAALLALFHRLNDHRLFTFLPRLHPAPSRSFLHNQDEDLSDIHNKRWLHVEVHALVKLRSGMEPRFHNTRPKTELWEEISAAMAGLGYERSAQRCKEKWENMKKYFRKAKDSCRPRPPNAKTCPYFHHLDTLYRKGILTSPSTAKHGSHAEGRGERAMEYSRWDGDGVAQDESQCAGSMAAVTATAETVPHRAASPVANMASQPLMHCVLDSSSNSSVSSALSSGGFEGLSTKLKMEGFVIEMLELQQQEQKLMEEYERMEQAREMREEGRRQEPHDMHLLQQGCQ